MIAFLTISHLALALAVAWISICRLRLLRRRMHQPLWVEAYFLLGCWSGSEILALAEDGPRLTTMLGLAAATLWLIGSRRTWRKGVPAYLEINSGSKVQFDGPTGDKA